MKHHNFPSTSINKAIAWTVCHSQLSVNHDIVISHQTKLPSTVQYSLPAKYEETRQGSVCRIWSREDWLGCFWRVEIYWGVDRRKYWTDRQFGLFRSILYTCVCAVLQMSINIFSSIISLPDSEFTLSTTRRFCDNNFQPSHL